MTHRTHVRAPSLLALSVLSAFALSGVGPAGAAQPRATVTGTVHECGPGPIVSVPGQATPTPTSASVALVRHHRTWAVQLVHFSHRTWTGTFTLSAPAGRYEVVVAIPSYPVRWVTIMSGSRKALSFPMIACAD